MAHTTFYRKYRSQNFAQIQGQDHVVQTLSNAITHDRLSHAYIFSGPRGTGKTSMARIMAKSLNCRNGKSATPCLECDLCKKISAGNSVDVIEIDAASNTGVDNIRSLNEQVNFAPVECLYKLYIIDEAHMLSTGAFNALLKTLEEPPENTIFILATTEPHKIPVTIHSRCQHLHCRSMSVSEIMAQLTIIATNENIEINEDGLTTIARNAGGSMRDAVSLFDQIYSFKGNTITQNDILQLLGASNIDALIALVSSLCTQDAAKAMLQFQGLVDQGCNMTQLTQDLMQLVKDMILISMSLEKQLDLDAGRIDAIKSVIKQTSFDQLNNILEMLAKTELDLRWFPRPEILLQIRLMGLIHQVAQEQVQAQRQVPATPQAQSYAAPPVNRAPTQVSRPATPVTASGGGLWAQVLNRINTEKKSLYSIIKDSTVTQKGEVLELHLKQNFKFFRVKITENNNKALINRIASEIYGQPVTIALSGEAAIPVSKSIVSAPSINRDLPTQNTSSSQSESIADAPVEIAPPEPIDINDGKAKKINQIIQIFDGSIV